MKKRKLYQQGDVLFKKVATLPEGKQTPVERRPAGYILAEGEATGHVHAVQEEVELVEIQGVLYIRSAADFTVTHQEHKPITLPPGIWEIGKVREYDHFAEEVRFIAD
jgi:hypothetical protein